MSEDQKIETLADEVRELNRLRNIAAKSQAEVMKQHNKILALIPSALAEIDPEKYELCPKGIKSARVFAVFNGQPLTQADVVSSIGDMNSDEVYGALRNCERRGFISADRSVTPYLYRKIVAGLLPLLLCGCSLVREPAWMDAPTEDTQRKSPSMKSPSVSPLLTPRMPPMVVNPMERVIRKEAEKRRRVAAHTNFRSRFNVQSSTVQPIPVPPSPIPSGMKVTVDSYEQAKRKALIKFQAAQRQQALNSTPPLPVPPGMKASVRAPTPVRGQSMMRAPAPNIPVNFEWVHSPSPGVKTYSVDFGSHTNYLTNQLVTGYVTNATVLIPSDGQRRYFGMRASNGANYSERTPLVMFPPDIIYTGNVESGPLAGPYTNFVQLFRFTNSPPEPEQGFKVSITTEKNYAP